MNNDSKPAAHPAANPAANEENSEALAFEDALDKLERLVEQIDSGECSLEQALRTFEEGVKLARQCQKTLNDAELRINKLLESERAPDTAKTSDSADAA